MVGILTSTISSFIDAVGEALKKVTFDPAIHQSIDEAIGELQKSSNELQQGALLVKTPATQVAGTKRALNGAKSMLCSVIRLISLEDQGNIFILVNSVKELQRHLNHFSTTVNEHSYQVFFNTENKLYANFLSLVDSRLEILESVAYKERLINAKDIAQRDQKELLSVGGQMFRTTSAELTTLAAKVAEKYIADLDNVVLVVKDISMSLNRMFGEACSMKQGFTTFAEDEVIKHANLLNAPLKEWVQFGNAECAKRAVAEGNKLLKASQAVEVQCNDATKKAMYHAANEYLRESLQRAVMANKDLLTDPTNPMKKARFVAALGDVECAKRAIVKLVESPRKGFVSAAGSYIGDLLELKEAIANDPLKAKAIAEGLEKRSELFFKLAEAYVDSIEDDDEKLAAKKKLERLRALNKELILAAQKAAANPHDKKAQEEYIAKFRQFIAEAETLVSPDEIMKECQSSAAGCLVEELASLFGNKSIPVTEKQRAVLSMVGELGKRVQEQLRLATEVCETVKDQKRRVALLKAIELQKSQTAKLIVAAKDYSTNPTSTAESLVLEEARKVKLISEKITELSKKSAEEINEKTQMRKATLVRKVDDSKKKRSSVKMNGPVNTELFAAAVELQDHLNKELPQDVENARVLNTTIDIGNQVAQLMADLAAAYAKFDVKTMIQKSKEISAAVKKLTVVAVKVNNVCEDKILSDEVRVHAEAAENFTMQMKLMSALKAASGEGDNASEEQLIAAGNGVSREVSRLVNSIQAAGLHKSVRTKKL